MTRSRQLRRTVFGICFAVMGIGEHFDPSTVCAGALESESVSGPSDGQSEQKSSRLRLVAHKLPLYFVENKGQVDARVAYYVQGKNQILYFTPQGLTLVLRENNHDKRQIAALGPGAAAAGHPQPEMFPPAPRRLAVRLDFVGADSQTRPQGEEPAPALVSYFVGSESEWKTGLKTYRRLVYRDVWTGIDLVYSGWARRLKYEFVVHPGADPRRIKLRYRGADEVSVNGRGQLEVKTAVGEFQDDRPYAYQEVDGRPVEVSVGYEIQSQIDAESHQYGFHLGLYDPARPLIIDPTLWVYAGFIGGTGDDRGNAITIDDAGNAYITGETNSIETTFPDGNGFGLLPGFDKIQNGGVDVFVAKINAAGTALEYATYIGGSGDDRGNGIALQPGESGCPPACSVFVVGETNSPGSTFPTVTGPDLTQNGGVEAFVAKLDPSGTALVYAGYIGGGGEDRGKGIVVDGAGAAYVTGETNSTELTFPVVTGPDPTHNGAMDAFVAKVNPSGTALDYAGYIGGVLDDRGNGIALQPGESGCPPDCSVYIVGETSSSEASFPDGDGFISLAGFDQIQNGGIDAFVVKVDAAGTALQYATYIGGVGDDRGKGIAVDVAGSVYITGETNSIGTNFPDGDGFGLVPGFDQTYNGGIDAFVAKLNTTGTALLYATYIGGAADDRGNGIVVDASQNAYVTGETNSTEVTFPNGDGVDPFFSLDRTHNGGVDAFMVVFNPAGTVLSHGTYIGGLGDDRGKGIAADAKGNIYVVGETSSNEGSFPKKIGPDGTQNGGVDAFVAKICSPVCADLSVTKSASPTPVRVGDPLTYTITVTNKGPDAATNVVVTDTLPGTVNLVSTTPSAPTCDATVTSVTIVACDLGALIKGASATVTILVTPTVLGTLINNVSVTADQADENLRNNTATLRTAATLPNLVVTKLQSVKAAIPGTDIVIEDTTANIGKVVAEGRPLPPPPPTAAVTKFYLSADSKFDGGDTFLGSRSVALPLAAKDNSSDSDISSGSTTVTIPLSTVLGKYFLIAVPDADDAVEETQESNKKGRRIKITRPDLTVASLKAPTSAARGSGIAVEDTTSNKAPVPAGGSTTRFYLSADALLDGGDTLLVNSRPVPALEAGGKSAGSTSVTIPFATVPGTYFLLAVADADGAVTETNDGNNVRGRKITITP